MLIKSEHNGHILLHDEEQHLYTIDGKPLTGTTSLLSKGYPKSKHLIDWQVREGAKWVIEEVCTTDEDTLDKDKLIKLSPNAYKVTLDEAADIGTIVHDYCYHKEAGKLYELEQHSQHKDWLTIVKCADQFDVWREGLVNDKTLHLEELVCSPEHMFAGRFDRLSNRDGVITLTDYKTSSGFFITQFIQLAAYTIAIKEWLGIVVENLEIVRFDKKTGNISTRDLHQLAATVKLSPATTLKRLVHEFLCIIQTVEFKDRFDKYIRK